MTKTSLTYFVLVRGLFQFGVLAAALYVLLNVLMDGPSLATLRWGIVFSFPVFGLFLGLLMWWLEQRKKPKDG